MILSEFI